MKDKILERFLRYVSYNTQSDPQSDTYPSTARQLLFMGDLVEEMISIGLHDVEIDAYGYVTATIPSTAGRTADDVIALISHVDTSPDMSGEGVKPQIIEEYDGSDIALGRSGYTLSPREFPELLTLIGHTLITTDGTTLLGADDKAGVAEIMTAAHYLMEHPEIEHGAVRIAFTPDEEVGAGVDHFDVARFGAKYAYTIDGSALGELEYENFNAAQAVISIEGRNIHPGYALNKMVNALQVAADINMMLPLWERPENTDGYNGFFHLCRMDGTVEHAEMEYIIRDHSLEKFEKKKSILTKITDAINTRFDFPRIKLTITDQYYNMRQMIEPHPEIIDRATKAMERAGVTPVIKPIRGGTDGARLSYMGLPCPNIFTGGMNFHGRFEYCSLTVMEMALNTIINLIADQEIELQ